jgi:hypothetical protein
VAMFKLTQAGGEIASGFRHATPEVCRF